MKKISKMILAGLFLISISIAGGSASFAGSGSPDSPSGSPPHGVAVQSDAQGIKLTGVVTIEFYNIREEILGNYADARIVARLNKGSVMRTLQGEAFDVFWSSPSATQQVIEEVMKPVVLDTFFGGDQSLSVTLKSFDKFGEADFVAGSGSTLTTVVANIVLAVK